MNEEIIQVLMIEDSLGEARLITRFINEVPGISVKLEHTFRLSLGLERLSRGGIDVVLLDLGLPDSMGVETIVKVREAFRTVPIVVLTGMDDEELGLKAVQLGAQDYVSKMQIDPQLLVRSVRYAIERKRSEEALRESEELFRRIAENIQEGLTIIENGKITYVNESACRILGYSKNEIIENNYLNLIFPEDKGKLGQVFEEKQKTNSPLNELEFWISGKDGSRRCVQNRYFNFNKSGRVINSYVITTDITEKKLSKVALQRAFRARTVLSDCNQSLIRTSGENELLQEICCNIVKNGGYVLAWIGFSNNDEDKTITPVAQFGYEDGYLEKLNLTYSEKAMDKYSPGRVIRTGKHTVINNLHSDPDYAHMLEEAVKRGYASLISIPLINENKPIGSLNIYASEPDAFDEDEVTLLIQLTENLTYGIKMRRLAYKD